MVTKKPKRPLWLYDEINRQNFWLFAGWDFEETQSYVKKQVGVEIERLPNKDGTSYFTEKVTVIWLMKFKAQDPKSQGLLVHECIHASTECLGARGYHVNWQNDEGIAYHSQWLYTKFMEQLL